MSELAAGEMGGREGEAMARHIASCAGCRAEAEGFLLAEAALKALARIETAPDSSAELRRMVVGARGRRSGWRWAAAGVVAAVVIAVAVWPRGGDEAVRSARQEARVTRVEAPLAGAPAEQTSVRRPVGAAPTTGADGSCVEAGMSTPAPRQRLRHGGDAETFPPHKTAAAPRTGLPQGQEQAAFAEATAPKARAEREVAARMPLLREGMDGSQGQAGMGMAGLRETADGRRAGADPSTALRAGLRALQNGGVILVLGRPEPVLPSGSCRVEVTLADGTKTLAEQSVERDAAGRPQSVTVAYERIALDAAAVQQGG